MCEYCEGALAALYQISTNGSPSFRHYEPPYCPNCGTPLSDEAKEKAKPRKLTLEELKEATNMPVWTVTYGLEDSGRWELIGWKTVQCSPYLAVLECINILDMRTEYPLDTYEKTWCAYTAPPDEERE